MTQQSLIDHVSRKSPLLMPGTKSVVRRGTARAESCTCDALCGGEEAYGCRATKRSCMPAMLAMADSMDKESCFQSPRLQSFRVGQFLLNTEKTRQPARSSLVSSR